ncbi:hypothetical protein C0J52_07025 [Blattella germanica]|nr:hypothetical protein C0J52_07025 [Blattella germanica]
MKQNVFVCYVQFWTKIIPPSELKPRSGNSVLDMRSDGLRVRGGEMGSGGKMRTQHEKIIFIQRKQMVITSDPAASITQSKDKALTAKTYGAHQLALILQCLIFDLHPGCQWRLLVAGGQHCFKRVLSSFIFQLLTTSCASWYIVRARVPELNMKDMAFMEFLVMNNGYFLISSYFKTTTDSVTFREIPPSSGAHLKPMRIYLPGGPLSPFGPEGGVNPGSPLSPFDPGKPGAPSKPGLPGYPDSPTGPCNPGVPGRPSNPRSPLRPGTPGNPGVPERHIIMNI